MSQQIEINIPDLLRKGFLSVDPGWTACGGGFHYLHVHSSGGIAGSRSQVW